MKKIFSFIVLLSLVFTAILPVNVSAAVSQPDLKRLACGNGTFVSIDNNNIVFSKDCINWDTVVSDSKTYTFKKVIWGNNEFMILAENPKLTTSTTILRSEDGIKWDAVQDEDTKKYISSIIWAGNKYIAVGYKVLLTSDNGTEWTKQDIGDATFLNDAIYDGKQYVAVGGYCGSGRILKSPDGVTWTTWYELMKNCGDDSFNKIFYTGEYYLIETNMNKIFYSKDLVSGQIINVNPS